MYLKKITIRNIKCFANLEISFTNGDAIHHWTTLLGENGLGKSTLLQAIGAALAGPSAIRELLPVAEGWPRQGQPYGEIEAEIQRTEGDAQMPGWPKTKPYIARYIVTGNDPQALPESLTDHYYTLPTLVPWSGTGTPKERENATKNMRRLQQTAYAEGKPGWLGCGYGPFRRLSGGGQDADRVLYAERKSARFLTLFREDAALTNATEWLIKLHNTARDGDELSQKALTHIRTAFKERLFPEPVTLEVNARAVQLTINGHRPVSLQDLSDGYRSMLALCIDLFRWLVIAFPDAPNPMNCPGIVLIDELDAHLHPKWQQQIGHWLCEKFPNIQFIITTHSPFLAQMEDKGQNIKLAKKEGSVGVLLTEEAFQDLRADQILQSPLFNLESLYSPPTQAKLNKHRQLHEKKLGDQLNKDEQLEYDQLTLFREGVPLLANSMDRRLEQFVQKAVQQQKARLQELA